MDMQGTDQPQPDPVTEQMMALDSAIATAEEILADADKGIEKLIEKRGKLAKDVQHLWIRRHTLNQKLMKMQDELNAPGMYRGGFIR